jgi:anti-sigma regulatory factor (Ser/Thr protein kinase)
MPCDAAAPAAIRKALHELADLGPALGDVIMIASELVSNAVRHSGGRARHDLDVSAFLWAGRVTIAVTDPGFSGRSAERRARDNLQTGGWGLQIVEQLADRWGTEREGGYRVWAEVAVSPPPKNEGWRPAR